MATDPTPARCPQCNHLLDPGTTVCPNCGHILAGEEGTTEALTLASATAASADAEATPTTAAEEPAPDDVTADTLPVLERSEPAEEALESQSQPRVTATLPDVLASPPIVSAMPPTAPKAQPASRRGNRKLVIIFASLAALLILGVIGAGILYATTRPQPVISVSSDYHVGKVPAGAASTTLHVEGKQFSSYSGIIFLLDGHPAPGSQVMPSDEDGTFQADLPVTAAWKIGSHQLTARDANGYTTKSSVTVRVVHQGEASTAGPLGSPADDTARFSLFLTTLSQQVGGISLPPDQGFPLDLFGGGSPETLTVQGQPNPIEGKVCNLPQDDGQQHTVNGSLGNGTVIIGSFPSGGNLVFVQQETTVFTCSGTYQNGKISFTETNTVAQDVYSNGVTCSLAAPRISYQLDGAFNSATTATGTYSIPESSLKCSDGSTQESPAETGTWIAFLSM